MSKRRILSPKEQEQFDAAQRQLERTLNDQKSAEARFAEQSERLGKKFKEGSESVARKRKALEDKKKTAEERYQIERKKYLSKPLNQSEQSELIRLEDLANSGLSVAPDTMKRLADLRTRSKVKEDVKGKE